MIFNDKQYAVSLSELIKNKLVPSTKQLSTEIYKNMPVRTMMKKYLVIDGYKILPIKERFLVSSMDGIDVNVLTADELDNQFAEVMNVKEDNVDVLYLSLHPGIIGEILIAKTNYPVKAKELAKYFKIPEAEKLGDQDIIDEAIHIIEESVSGQSPSKCALIDVASNSMPEVDSHDPVGLLSRSSNGIYVPYQSPQILYQHLNTSARFMALGDIE